MIEFFNVLKLGEVLGRLMPFTYTSPNAIAPQQTLPAFVISIIAGARRLAHTDSRAETACRRQPRSGERRGAARSNLRAERALLSRIYLTPLGSKTTWPPTAFA